MLFWLAVEKLKKETDKAAVKELAQTIYRDYLSSESPKEVRNQCSVYDHLKILRPHLAQHPKRDLRFYPDK